MSNSMSTISHYTWFETKRETATWLLGCIVLQWMRKFRRPRSGLWRWRENFRLHHPAKRDA